MAEQIKTLVRRLVEEVWNRGDYAVVDELVGDDYLGHPSEVRGTEGYKQFFMALRGAFPDIEFTIQDQIAEGDKVVVRWTARGTHDGDYFGIPPTGRAGVITGVEVLKFADGKATTCWGEVDQLGLLQQLGVISLPVPAT
ncbi:MAG: ester cyclase [Nitriliruptorales bacterium]|nr:ester cyclase [Nitriliruptorales bacterium]